MIIVIILILLALLGVIFLLRDRWEIKTDELYYLLPSSVEQAPFSRDLQDTEEFNSCNDLEVFYKEHKDLFRKEDYDEWAKTPNAHKSYRDYSLRHTRVFVRKEVKKRIGLNRCYDLEDHIASGIDIVVFGLGALICGVICLIANSSYTVKAEEIKYNEQIVLLEKSKVNLLSYYETGTPKDIDISASGLPAAIDAHNEKVADLVKDVKSNRIYKTNPWINWFVCPVYDKVDLPRIEATYISVQ